MSRLRCDDEEEGMVWLAWDVSLGCVKFECPSMIRWWWRTLKFSFGGFHRSRHARQGGGGIEWVWVE